MVKLSKDEEFKLWNRLIMKWEKGWDYTRERNILWENYLYLAKYFTYRYAAKTPLGFDDLITAAQLGLYEAIEKFDPSQNVRFSTYSAQRICGSIRDEIRSLDHVPRLTRMRQSAFLKAQNELACRLGYTPSPEEVCQLLGVWTSAPAAITSLDDLIQNTLSENRPQSLGVLLRDRRVPRPEQGLLDDAFWHEACVGLSGAERTIIRLYYRDGKTMKAVGKSLGLSESRVSQIHTAVLPRIKARLLREDMACA